MASGAVEGARGLLGRAVSLAVDAGRYLRTTAVGPAMEDPAALAQAVVRTVASHSHLLDKLPQILNGSLDLGTQSTGVVGTRVEFKVEGYFKNVTRGLESPDEGALVTERWHVSGRGSGVTVSSSSSHSGSPMTQVGLAFSQGGVSGRYGLGVGRSESDTRSDGVTGYRITSQSGGRLVWFRADLTMVIEARRGRHQLLHDLVSDLGSRDPEVRRTAVEIPQAVDFFIDERDLVRYPRLAEIAGLTDLPAPPPRNLPLPATYVSSGGSVGTGTVTEVTEVTEPTATANNAATAGAAGPAARKALRQTVEDLVENIAPGSTTVGRGAHVPGLRERIGELTSPRSLQALIAARHSSVSFVANSWLGPRLVRISLTANPAPGFESVLGRPVAAGTDLETQFVRATGKGVSSRRPVPPATPRPAAAPTNSASPSRAAATAYAAVCPSATASATPWGRAQASRTTSGYGCTRSPNTSPTTWSPTTSRWTSVPRCFPTPFCSYRRWSCTLGSTNSSPRWRAVPLTRAG